MENASHTHKKTAVLFAIAGIILFSSKAILVKKAYMYGIDTVSLLLLRMVFALPFYIIIAAITSWRHRKETQINLRQFIAIILLGLAGYYLASYLDFSGLNYISASLERLILFIYPTLVVLLTSVVYRNRIPRNQAIAILITYFGIFLVFFQDTDPDTHSNMAKGTVLILGSALTYACYLVGSGNLIPKLGSVRFTSYAMIISCLAVFIHFSVQEHVDIRSYPSGVYQLGIAMALICTILPSFLIAEAIRRLGASQVAIIGSIGPVSTIVLAWIFLGEKLGGFQWMGTIIVISGVMLIKRKKDEDTRVIAAIAPKNVNSGKVA